MVELKYFAVFILLLHQSINSELVVEESKQIFVKSKKNYKSGQSKDFHCDLSLLPQQKKMMFSGLRMMRNEKLFDIYKWPKNNDGSVIVPYWISRDSQYSE